MMIDLVENGEKEKAVMIQGREIDNIVIYEDKITLYILPSGHFTFEIAKKEFDGEPFTVSTYDA